MNQEVFIYGLVDPITNQLRYIGKSINPVVRLRKHISERNLHDSYKDRWIRKLYDNNLKPELIIIDLVKKDNWQYWEMFYILYFKFIGCILTNGTNGGDEPPTTKGRKHSEESKKKMSDSKRGKPIPWLNNGKERSLEHKQKLSESSKGRVSPNKGKKFNDEYRKKLSDSHKWQAGENHPFYGKKHSVETKNKLAKIFSVPVLQFNLFGEFIQEWDSIKLAQDNLKIKNISNACKGKYKTAGGFIWKYK